MGFNDYQDSLDRAAERSQMIEQYIDEHELLQDTEAFGASETRNEEALREIWRIVITTRSSDSDIGMADIRSVLDALVLAAAERFATKIIENRDILGVPV